MFGLSTLMVTVVFGLIFGWTYLGRRIISLLPVSKKPRVVFWFFLGVMFALPLIATLSYRHDILQHFSNYETFFWFAYIILGFLIMCFFQSVIVDIFRIMCWFIRKRGTLDNHVKWTCPKFLNRYGPFFILVFGLIFTVIGVYKGSATPTVKTVQIVIENLPEELQGFKIVHLTDLHMGPMRTGQFLERIVELVNATNPDVVVITGDLVDGKPDFFKNEISSLSKFRSTYGTYFTTGNHEYYWDANKWIEIIKSFNTQVLLNSHHVINHHGKKIILAGIPDTFRGFQFQDDHKPDINLTLKGAPKDASVKILLSHNADGFKLIKNLNFDLQLSGHTHGGQFYPIRFVSMILFEYVEGLYKRGKTWVYVSPGAGVWGPPLRLGTTSEITVLSLTKTQ